MDTPEEEKMWLVRRFDYRHRKYGLRVATEMLQYDLEETTHYV
jgi:hypothetical protein